MTSGRIGLGETVTWRATHFCIPLTMTSSVTGLEPPYRFLDEQVRGPFRAFHHEHLFEALDGGTRMIDRIRFDAPFGPVGRHVERPSWHLYLQKLIAVRGEYLEVDAGAVTERAVPVHERQTSPQLLPDRSKFGRTSQPPAPHTYLTAPYSGATLRVCLATARAARARPQNDRSIPV